MSDFPVPLDRQSSALEQVQRMAAEHPLPAWSAALEAPAGQPHPPTELATLLLALNYELLGYTPQEAWMFARREESARPDRLDG